MSESNNKVNINDFEIGFTPDASAMIVSIPLKKWANDSLYGDILVSGTFIKAERIALKNLQLLRQKQATNGLLKPATAPLNVA